jgi:class 3 adenylate cyclase
MLLSIVLFAVFGLWDSSNSVQGSEQTRFRFFVAIPLLLIVFGATFTPLFKEGLEYLFAWAFAFSSSTLAAAQILHYDNGPLSLDSGTTALNFALICVAGIGLFPLSVMWSLVTGSTIILIYVVSILSFTTIVASVFAAYLFNIANIFSVLILMSYWRERFTREEFARNWLQEKERQKLSTFLSSYIPLTSLEETNNSSLAESFGEVTLLFSDIVGFTVLTEHLAPKHVLEILDQVFSEFDLAADRHGIEKVKTIGDAYMAISGKSAGAGNPAKAMIDFALDAIAAVDKISDRVGFTLKIRVGVHTGSTIGGIVGKQKRTYDYWGRTVNLASRLESTGEPNKIHISEATYWRVREFFSFEERGLTALKGIGSERSFFIAND